MHVRSAGTAVLAVAVVVGVPAAGHGATAAPPDCTAGQVKVAVSSGRDAYARGQHVDLRVTIRNRSDQACSIATGSCVPEVIVTTSGGVVVWDRAQTQVVCDVGVGRSLAAHSRIARKVRWDGTHCAGRDPRSCPGDPVRPGRYRATATWSGYGRAATTFRVTG